MINQNNLLSIEIRISTQEKNLKRIIGWILASDAKIATILAFQVGLVAFLTSKIPDIKKLWIQHQVDNWSIWFFAPLAIFTLYIISSSFKSFKTLFPDTEIRDSSLLFFGSIINLSLDKFRQGSKNLTYEKLEDELLSQVHVNSEIASYKFNYVKASMRDLLIAGVAWLISLIALSSLL